MGQRPVINLKTLNQFVNTEHFKMEGIHTVKDPLRPGDWLTKVNLKDAKLPQVLVSGKDIPLIMPPI